MFQTNKQQVTLNFLAGSRFSQRGVAIYLAFMVMTLLLALALGISAIVFGQIKTIRSMGDSVVALYAADTGIEDALMRADPLTECPCAGSFANGAIYSVQTFLPTDPSCTGATNYCVRSVGEFNGTRRAIQISR